MSTLNFEPTAPKRRWGSANQKTLGVILGVAALAAAIAVGSTLAASITLNSGNSVEFGQGVAQTVSCAGTDQSITSSPKA